jgi:DNA/RNA-binding domain of Phe-tRNA-synthetase-like protein
VTDTINGIQHLLLRPVAFVTGFPEPIAAAATPLWLSDLLRLDAISPFQPDEQLRARVRDALRTHGYKPTGRGKPASEYLARAAAERALPSINLPVDACNVVSLHSGFPISVVDLERARPPFHIAIAGNEQSYIFNASGQEIHLGGLPCLYDELGPCASPVKDSQRTKTGPSTRRTLSILWGCSPHQDRAGRALAWYRELLERAGATTSTVAIGVPSPPAS